MRAPKWTGDALELAHVLLCTVRLDGGTHTIHVHAAVKTELESEQTRELQRVPQLELRWHALLSYRRRRMVQIHQDLDRASPTRFAIEQAIFRGR